MEQTQVEQGIKDLQWYLKQSKHDGKRWYGGEKVAGCYVLPEMNAMAFFMQYGEEKDKALVQKYSDSKLKFRDQVADAFWKKGSVLKKRFYAEYHHEHSSRPEFEFLCCLRDLEEDMRFEQSFIPGPVKTALRKITETRGQFRELCKETLTKLGAEIPSEEDTDNDWSDDEDED